MVIYSKNLTGGTNVGIPRESNNQALPAALREKLQTCTIAKVVIQYKDALGRIFVVTQEA